MAGANSIFTGGQLLIAANATKGTASSAKIGLVPMELEKPRRVCKSLEAVE